METDALASVEPGLCQKEALREAMAETAGPFMQLAMVR